MRLTRLVQLQGAHVIRLQHGPEDGWSCGDVAIHMCHAVQQIAAQNSGVPPYRLIEQIWIDLESKFRGFDAYAKRQSWKPTQESWGPLKFPMAGEWLDCEHVQSAMGQELQHGVRMIGCVDLHHILDIWNRVENAVRVAVLHVNGDHFVTCIMYNTPGSATGQAFSGLGPRLWQRIERSPLTRARDVEKEVASLKRVCQYNRIHCPERATEKRSAAEMSCTSAGVSPSESADALARWSVEEELRLPEWMDARRTLSQFQHQRHGRYLDLICGAVQATLRWSCVPRRGPTGPLDVDIVNIAVENGHRRRGIGTRFCITLGVLVAELHKRGVYLEQCITPSSHALALRLLRMGWFYHPTPQSPSVLSHFPFAPLPAGAITFTPKPRVRTEQCDMCDGPVQPPYPCRWCPE